MTPDLKELERLARAATPGLWTYDGDTWELSAPSRKGKVEIATIETGWTEPMESEQQANIAYILAANPAAILSLIAELEQCRKDAAEKEEWKQTAMELAQRVNFAVTNCDCKGGGMLNTETMKIQDWRSYMADAMDMIPGVKVDREILATLHLPKIKRLAAQKKIKEDRAAIAKEQT